jgi:hypothetical protein
LLRHTIDDKRYGFGARHPISPGLMVNGLLKEWT